VKLEIHYDGGGEWAALYVDGVLDLDTVGDSYHAEERAFELLGVKQVMDSPFLRGSNRREDAAPTLDDIEAYRQRMEERERQVRRLLAEAAALQARAERLRGAS